MVIWCVQGSTHNHLYNEYTVDLDYRAKFIITFNLLHSSTINYSNTPSGGTHIKYNLYWRTAFSLNVGDHVMVLFIFYGNYIVFECTWILLLLMFFYLSLFKWAILWFELFCSLLNLISFFFTLCPKEKGINML